MYKNYTFLEKCTNINSGKQRKTIPWKLVCLISLIKTLKIHQGTSKSYTETIVIHDYLWRKTNILEIYSPSSCIFSQFIHTVSHLPHQSLLLLDMLLSFSNRNFLLSHKKGRFTLKNVQKLSPQQPCLFKIWQTLLKFEHLNQLIIYYKIMH